jgi:signal transduction histidine kinase
MPTERSDPGRRDHLGADGCETVQPSTAARAFVRRFRDDLLAEWRCAARELPIARDMTSVTLLDHIPALLDEIADIADELTIGAGKTSDLETARRHALDRLSDGFDAATIVSELSLLRDAVFAVWSRSAGSQQLADLRAINIALDRAIAVSVGRYGEVHDRTLAGIDRISTASFESSDVDDLMRRLLTVFIETTPAVDTAAILLVDGNQLRLRAAAGLEAELDARVSFALGEGFPGTIAARREPMQLRAAHEDRLATSDVIRERRVCALYGVPLMQNSRVIGVAYMGSLTAHEFSPEDRQFFGSMAARATLGIVHHLLRQELASSEQRFKQIASEREQALAKLESLLAASPIGIAFVDRELRYLLVNDALAALNEHPASSHLGRTVAEVLPSFAPMLEPLLRGVMDTGQPALNVEIARPDPSGTRFLLANYFPVRASSDEITGVGGIVIDATEIRRTQEALQVEQTRIRSILEHAPAAIWVKEAGGRIVLANHGLADVAATHEAHDATVLREWRAIEAEEVVPSPNGPRTFLSIKFPIPGDPPMVGGIATEITERKRMEEELRIAVRTREDVLAVVSHDLRGPLGAVQLSTTVLMSQLATADHRARRHLELIHRSCLRMEHLIGDLLDTAAIRTGRLQLDLRSEIIDSIIAEAIDLQHAIAQERGITLVSECEGGGGSIRCDRDRILQVFGNLIGNALKFCRNGDSVTVACRSLPDHVVFSVSDTGPGIEPEASAYLFDAYWSGANHIKQGAGLGLYICRGIVEGHGGRLWVESRPGAGATFLFTIHAARSNDGGPA